jgi:ribosomal protein S18 acetylase RimI-like enzyme
MIKNFFLIDLTCDSQFDSSALQISDITLGKGFLTSLDFYRGSNGVIIASFDNDKNQINGFCAGRVLDKDSFKKEFGFSFDKSDILGLIDPVCVHPDYQKMGIGVSLIKEVMSVLKTSIFITPVWSYINSLGVRTTNAGRSFEKLGFSLEDSSFHSWKEDCNIKFQCPLKNLSADCNCGINFYVKDNYRL